MNPKVPKALVCINFLKRSAIYAFDLSLTYGALFGLSKFWENTYRPVGGPFEPVYYSTILPAYAVIWSLSNYFSGGSDSPYKLSKIARGNTMLMLETARLVFKVMLFTAVCEAQPPYRFTETSR